MPRRKLEIPNYRLRMRGGNWYIDWTDTVSGRTRSVSTRQAERKQAEVWRDQWIAGREQPIPPSQATIAEIMRGYTEARLPHVEAKKQMLVFARTITRLVGNLQPHMLSRGSYSHARSATRPVADGPVRREIGVLRAALSWAVREQWIDRAPYIEMPPAPPPRDRWLTRDEIDRLARAASSPHIRLFIVLGFHTAARTGAILDLRWDRVDFTHRLVSYDFPGRRQTKKRRATVPLNVPALTALQEARAVAVTDHVIEWNGRRVYSIRRGFTQACVRAGLVDVTPHVLRHSAASYMVMAGVPIGEVARMLGDTIKTVEATYAKHAPDYLRRAADALAGEMGPRLERIRK